MDMILWCPCFNDNIKNIQQPYNIQNFKIVRLFRISLVKITHFYLITTHQLLLLHNTIILHIT